MIGVCTTKRLGTSYIDNANDYMVVDLWGSSVILDSINKNFFSFLFFSFPDATFISPVPPSESSIYHSAVPYGMPITTSHMCGVCVIESRRGLSNRYPRPSRRKNGKSPSSHSHKEYIGVWRPHTTARDL